jgi:hypothetical protein
MAINYTTQIQSLYAGSVAVEAAYQSPGTYGLPSGFGGTNAEKRILTFIEVVRAYMAVIQTNHEAKLLQDVMGRIMASMHLGTTTWNTTTMPVNAQAAALRFLAHHVIPSDV